MRGTDREKERYKQGGEDGNRWTERKKEMENKLKEQRTWNREGKKHH